VKPEVGGSSSCRVPAITGTSGTLSDRVGGRQTLTEDNMTVERVLATDLDGTFIGDDAAMFDLWDDLAAADVFVAFSTGRHLPSIEDFYAERNVTRRADACICMVGTELWWRVDGEYQRDDGWSRHISDAWDKGAVEAILSQIPDATMQAEEWQSEFKSSYYLEDNVNASLEQIADQLDRRRLQAKIVYSAGRFLDLLPHFSGKGGAVAYLARSLGVSPDNVVTSGDTGNDIDMMRHDLGFRSIAVGNASVELRQVREPQIYHATAPYAAGIREGLAYYGWLPGPGDTTASNEPGSNPAQEAQ
jgi:sucrose phosphatase-like protein